ncbi:MAG TPA: hypothetical protein VI382_10020 [Candidatus Manganitrophaceae bacterium]|nr:hypothetical protein [Candidatus Manganitrophaceae bacterium]
MRFVLLFLLGFLLLEGCGYSIKMVSVEEDRKARQNRKTLEEEVARLQSELQKLRQEVSELQKRRADVDIRLDETAMALRLIQGKIEKDDHRFKELSHQADDAAFRLNELTQLKTRLSEQEKKWDSTQKTMQSQIEAIKGISGVLQKSLETLNAAVATTLDDQEKKLKDLSALVSELAQKIPPLLNTQSAQLDELGKQFRRLGQAGDIEQMNRGLLELSNALNLLGEKMTAKIDEQDRILNKTTKRLEALESKVPPKGKRSADLPATEMNSAARAKSK